jgi:hypothetical protein
MAAAAKWRREGSCNIGENGGERKRSDNAAPWHGIAEMAEGQRRNGGENRKLLCSIISGENKRSAKNSASLQKSGRQRGGEENNEVAWRRGGGAKYRKP